MKMRKPTLKTHCEVSSFSSTCVKSRTHALLGRLYNHDCKKCDKIFPAFLTVFKHLIPFSMYGPPSHTIGRTSIPLEAVSRHFFYMSPSQIPHPPSVQIDPKVLRISICCLSTFKEIQPPQGNPHLISLQNCAAPVSLAVINRQPYGPDSYSHQNLIGAYLPWEQRNV